MTANFNQAIENIFKSDYKPEDLLSFSSVITGRSREELLDNLLQNITVSAEQAQDFFASLTNQVVGVAELNPKKKRSSNEMLVDKLQNVSVPKHLKKCAELLPHKDAQKHIRECLELINSNQNEQDRIIESVAAIGTADESEDGLMLLKVFASSYVNESDYVRVVGRLVNAAKGMEAIAV